MSQSIDLLDALAARVRRLERAQQRWQFASACLVVIGMIVLASRPGLSEGQELRTNRLLITDEKGKVVARFDGGVKAEPQLVLFDKSGDPRISLSVPENGPALLLNPSPKHSLKAGILQEPSGIFFKALDSENRVRTSLGYTKGGSALVLTGEGGRRKAMLVNTENGPLGVALFGDDKQRGTFFLSEGSGYIQAQDTDGKQVISLP